MPKYIKRRGRVTREWERTRRAWFRENPPDYRGFWQCGICGRPVDSPDLDHIKGRGSHPELRNDLANLRPVHRSCHIKIT